MTVSWLSLTTLPSLASEAVLDTSLLTTTRSMSPILPEDTVYFSGSWEAGQSLVLRQGFESVPHHEIQKIVNKELESRREFRSDFS